MIDTDELEKLPKQRIYMQQESTFKSLKQKLTRILNDANPYLNLTVDQVRFWKSNNSFTKPAQIASYLRTNKIGGAETIFKENDVNTPDIEENTGVEFPGL